MESEQKRDEKGQDDVRGNIVGFEIVAASKFEETRKALVQ